MKAIKDFNYKNIYYHPRLIHYTKYAELILISIFEILTGYYKNQDTLDQIDKDKEFYPVLTSHIKDWLLKYSNLRPKKTNIFKIKYFIILRFKRLSASYYRFYLRND